MPAAAVSLAVAAWTLVAAGATRQVRRVALTGAADGDPQLMAPPERQRKQIGFTKATKKP